MRITATGQVTIPADIREKAGLLPDTEVTFEVDGAAVRIVPAATPADLSASPGKGDQIVALLRGQGDGRLTTNEIMALTRGDE